MANEKTPVETVAATTGTAVVDPVATTTTTTTTATTQPVQAPASDPAAPTDLFVSTAAAAGEANPERVRIVIAQLKDYAEKMASAQADKATMRKGMASIVSAVRLAIMSSGADLTKILDAFIDAINKDTGGAFAESRVFSQIDLIPGGDRDAYVKLVGTMITYARLENKQRIHDRVNVVYIGDVFTTDISRKTFNAYFPKK